MSISSLSPSSLVERSSADRWHELDWLRVLMIGWVLLYHTGQEMRADAPALWTAMQVGREWRMPLVFTLAGAAAFVGLRRAEGLSWLRGRLRRLLVPLGLGLALLMPLAWSVVEPAPVGETTSVADAIGSFYGRLYVGSEVRWAHLWFIAYLALYAPLALALRAALLRGRSDGGSWGTRLAEATGSRLGLLLGGLPLLGTVALRDRWVASLTLGGLVEFKPVVGYGLLFLAGYLLAAAPRVWARLGDLRVWHLALAVALTALTAWLRAGRDVSTPAGHLLVRAGDLTAAAGSWTGVLALLGFGIRHLRRPSRVLVYLRDASYPFYLLSQPLLLIVAFVMREWPLSIVTRFALIAGVTAACTLAAYELAVRRVRCLRWLFGLAVRDRRAPVRVGAIPHWLSTATRVDAERAGRGVTAPERSVA